ncbi:MAG: TonB-dependent receptor, partial [Flavisolibacter sp.]
MKNLPILKTFILLPFLFGGIMAFSQTVIVRGTVKDANGQNLTGASVTVQGTNKGTTTDNSGNYSITLNPGKYTLIASYVGFSSQRQEVNVTDKGASQDFILPNAGDLGIVTVIGSRSASRTRTETPVPVDIIPLAQVINEVGQVDLNQILTYLAPSFQSSRQTIADGTDHLDPAQLRALGTDQVLVLINGKRRHQSALVNVNGTVNRGQVSTDLSAIPATAVERIEILRDGASAQYGSDAIAGVINIVLKKSVGILEANVSYGENVTKYPKNYALYKLAGKSDDPNVHVTDGGTIQGSLGYGLSIGKGYLNLTGEYDHRNRTNRAGTYTGRVYPNVSGNNRDDSIMSARGQTRDFFDMFIGSSEMRSTAVFYNFGLPVGLTGKGEIYVFGGYSKKHGISAGVYRYPNGYASPGNAEKYAGSALAMYPNGFLPKIVSDIMDFSTSVGFRTKFNEWNFDISNTYGINKFDFGVNNSVNYTEFAVTPNPQTSFDAGGLKFYQNTVNADITRKFDVLSGFNFAAGLEYRIDAFGIRSGEVASYKNYDTSASPKTAPGAQVFPGFVNTLGGDQKRNAKAAYIDLEQDFSNKFLLTGALRFENYSDFGSTLNFKVSSRYKFGDAFTLRGSVSSGFRAPSMQQRFYTKTNTLFINQGGSLVPTQAATFTNDSKAAQILGIPKLKQETSMNYSVGFTAKPLRGLEVTVDAYQIDIKNRIILTNNFVRGGNAQFNALLDSIGASSVNFFSNAVDTRARGLEAVISYSRKFLQKHSVRLTLAGTFIDNEVKKDANGKPVLHASDILINSGQFGNYFNREDQSRMEVAAPKDKISLIIDYKYSKLGVMLRFVRFGPVQYLDPSINPADPATFAANAFDNNAKETTDQTFTAKTVTDLTISYDVWRHLTASIGANNLFDVYPDIQTHNGNQSSGRFIYSRRVEQMGFNGAYFFARLKLTLP